MTTNNQGVDTRELALMILLEIERGEKSHIVLRQVLEKYQYLSKQDRAFLTRLAEGTTERRIELDYIINQFSKVKTEKMKPVIRNILRCAVYQIKYMDQVPDSAACNEAVNLAIRRRMHRKNTVRQNPYTGSLYMTIIQRQKLIWQI